jgi:hypothetical protein
MGFAFAITGFIFTLSTTILLLIKVKSKNVEIERLKSKVKKDVYKLGIGDKCLHILDLTNNSSGNTFTVYYEVSLLNVSDTKAKVKVEDISGTDNYVRDKSNRNGIINFLDGQWIDIKELKLIADEATKRDIKLEQILNG